MPLTHVFAEAEREIEIFMKLEDDPADEAEPKSKPVTSKAKKKDTIKHTETAFTVDGDDKQLKKNVWDGDNLILQYSDEKSAKHAFKTPAQAYCVVVGPMLQKKKDARKKKEAADAEYKMYSSGDDVLGASYGGGITSCDRGQTTPYNNT